MKTPALVALAFLAALTHAADSPMAVAKKAAADYRNGLLHKDYKGFEKFTTSDFVYMDEKGSKMVKSQVLASMKGMMKSMTIKSLKIDVVSAKMAEGGIVYVQDSKMVATMPMGGPKPSVMKSDSRSEVLLVKKDGKWLTKRVRGLQTKDTVDGKPMKM